METRTVGRSGLRVSAIGLGCNNFGARLAEDGASNVVKAALDNGMTFFDTADAYGNGESERILGQSLKGVRDEVVILTKFGRPVIDVPGTAGGSRRYIVRACEASLRRLGTDYIDVYCQHLPDGSTPIDETLSTLTDLVRSGKVRYIAVSNFAAWQMVDAAHEARHHDHTPVIAVQDRWNLLERDIEQGVVPACAHLGIGVIPYYPLAYGLLTGKYRRGEPFPADSRLANWPHFRDIATDDNFSRIERLTEYADQRGHSLLEMALSWLVAAPMVCSVIVGATTAAQVEVNVAASSWVLTDTDRREIDELGEVAQT